MLPQHERSYTNFSVHNIVRSMVTNVLEAAFLIYFFPIILRYKVLQTSHFKGIMTTLSYALLQARPGTKLTNYLFHFFLKKLFFQFHFHHVLIPEKNKSTLPKCTCNHPFSFLVTLLPPLLSTLVSLYYYYYYYKIALLLSPNKGNQHRFS